LAKTIFGEQNALNKILRLDNSEDVIITGIYEDLPLNSSFGEIRYIASWELFGKMQEFSSRSNQWRSNSYQAYIQLADHREMDEVSLKIKDAKLKKVREDERVHNPQLFLFPMSDWHLYSDFENGKNAGGRIQNVWLFGIIGIFVLMLACINFMNLSTAHSEKRSKEVGVRKVVGSQRGQLISQFMSEALLIAFLAFILSLVLVKLILPYFNLLTENKMTILWTNPIFWTLGFGFVLVTGLLAGSYPAIYLSSLRPLTVLKGTFRPGRLSSVPRKALVVFQFTIAVILMIGTVIVFRQVQFAQNRPMGYNNDGLVMLPVFGPEIHDHFDVVKEELFGIQAITGMAESSGPLTDVWSTNSGFDWKGKDPGLALDFPNTAVSVDFGRTVGWTFEAGRDFSSEFISDSSAIILNKAAADFIGFEDPIGETITWDGNPYTVIGVIRDMIMDSPYTPVRPSVYHLLKDEGYIIVKLNGERSADKSIELIESVFKKISPDQPFIYQFAEVEYAKKFGDEQRIGKLSTYFSALAIFISCLGIFGLSSYVAERRTKEIGIRKVLGASIRNIWQMLSGDFVVLVLVSCLIALPAAWFLMKQWLKGYAFHTEISWWIFAGSGLLALVLTLLTVSFQALKAADMNPVDSLRSE
jgi:ABC-type antimicrobial peptide transport system permease subunit